MNAFLPPDALVAHVHQATSQGQYTLMSNVLLSQPAPSIPPTNGTLSEAQLAMAVQLIDTHYASAVTLANQWQNGDPGLGQVAVHDAIVDVFSAFRRFLSRFPDTYAALIDAAYRNDAATVRSTLGQIQSLLEEIGSTTNGTSKAVQDYETALVSIQSTFESDYRLVMEEVTSVSNTISQLESQIAALKAQMEANNKAVLAAGLAMGQATLVNGASAFGASGPGGVLTAGVQFGIALGTGLEKIIELEAAMVAILEKIRTLSAEVSEDDRVLAALINIGTMLLTLGAGQEQAGLAIVSDILGYWSSMSDGIGELLQTSGDLSEYIDTTNYSPTTVHQRNPAFPPWNVTLPLATAEQVFERVQSATPVVFDDGTTFRPLAEP